MKSWWLNFCLFSQQNLKMTVKWSTFQNGRSVNASIMFIQTSWTIKERVKVFEVNISMSEYLKTLPFFNQNWIPLHFSRIWVLGLYPWECLLYILSRFSSDPAPSERRAAITRLPCVRHPLIMFAFTFTFLFQEILQIYHLQNNHFHFNQNSF